MKATGSIVIPGGDYDAWDLEVRGGVFGSTRLLMAVEDSGSGTQLVRVRSWPHCHWLIGTLLLALTSLSLVAGVHRSERPAMAFGALAMLVFWRVIRECGVTTQTIEQGLVSSGLLGGESASRVLLPNRERA
jgi:hypothetical protein